MSRWKMLSICSWCSFASISLHSSLFSAHINPCQCHNDINKPSHVTLTSDLKYSLPIRRDKGQLHVNFDFPSIQITEKTNNGVMMLPRSTTDNKLYSRTTGVNLYHITTFGFCLTSQSVPRLQKVNHSYLWSWFYKSDVLPVAQPIASVKAVTGILAPDSLKKSTILSKDCPTTIH